MKKQKKFNVEWLGKVAMIGGSVLMIYIMFNGSNEIQTALGKIGGMAFILYLFASGLGGMEK